MKFGLFGRIALAVAVLLLAGAYLVPAFVFFTPPEPQANRKMLLWKSIFPTPALTSALTF